MFVFCKASTCYVYTSIHLAYSLYPHSLLLRFTDDTFDPELAATIGESGY